MFSTTTSQILYDFSYIAQIFSSLSVIIIAVQVYISLKDIRIKSKREATFISMQQAEKYAKEVIPEAQRINELFKSGGCPLKRNKVLEGEDFKQELKNPKGMIQAISFFGKDDKLFLDTQNLLNSLEAFSMFFTSGIGSESVVFLSLGNSFCSVVEMFSFAISSSINLSSDHKSYPELMCLYRIWSKRIEKDKLVREGRDIFAKISNMKDEEINPIGL